VQANRSGLRAALAALVLAAPTAWWLGGCSSDEPNRVGAGLVDAEIDSVLVELTVKTVNAYGAVRVEDDDLPLHRQQVLYMGSQGGVTSRILANFDFSDIYSDVYPEAAFALDNIKTVKLSLHKLAHYKGSLVTGQPVNLYYQVRQLTAPFDSLDFGYPSPAPEAGIQELSANPDVPYQESEPGVLMRAEDFRGWLNAGQTVGLIIAFGADSDSGLVGFGARELVRYSEIESVGVGTIVAPNFIVEFNDGTTPRLLLAPVADTSTFEVVPPAPADIGDGFVLRTCLRSYPACDFDFSRLPDDVLINRAVLRLTNNQELAFGNSEAIVVSELDSLKLAAASSGTMSFAALDSATYVITGQTSLDPTHVRHLAFDVTTLVQRLVNDVYPDPRGLVLTAGEDIFPTYDLTSVDPDFYFTEFRFFGTTAEDSLKPRLEITYSRHEDRMGGAR